MAGEFDTVALDRRCRFLLVGRNLIEKKHEAISWTLVPARGAEGPRSRGQARLTEATYRPNPRLFFLSAPLHRRR